MIRCQHEEKPIIYNQQFQEIPSCHVYWQRFLVIKLWVNHKLNHVSKTLFMSCNYGNHAGVTYLCGYGTAVHLLGIHHQSPCLFSSYNVQVCLIALLITLYIHACAMSWQNYDCLPWPKTHIVPISLVICSAAPCLRRFRETLSLHK